MYNWLLKIFQPIEATARMSNMTKIKNADLHGRSRVLAGMTSVRRRGNDQSQALSVRPGKTLNVLPLLLLEADFLLSILIFAFLRHKLIFTRILEMNIDFQMTNCVIMKHERMVIGHLLPYTRIGSIQGIS